MGGDGLISTAPLFLLKVSRPYLLTKLQGMCKKIWSRDKAASEGGVFKAYSSLNFAVSMELATVQARKDRRL